MISEVSEDFPPWIFLLKDILVLKLADISSNCDWLVLELRMKFSEHLKKIREV